MRNNIIFYTLFLAILACNPNKKESALTPSKSLPKVSQISNDSKYSPEDLRKGEITLKSGEKIKIRIALSTKEQERGLSGVKRADFADDEGMLFFYSESQYRRFWMPDTYFNLDIFFLDKQLNILQIQRDVQHYIGRKNPQLIPTTKTIFSRHILEMKSSSPISKKLHPGDKLIWSSSPSLLQIGLEIHRDL